MISSVRKDNFYGEASGAEAGIYSFLKESALFLCSGPNWKHPTKHRCKRSKHPSNCIHLTGKIASLCMILEVCKSPCWKAATPRFPTAKHCASFFKVWAEGSVMQRTRTRRDEYAAPRNCALFSCPSSSLSLAIHSPQADVSAHHDGAVSIILSPQEIFIHEPSRAISLCVLEERSACCDAVIRSAFSYATTEQKHCASFDPRWFAYSMACWW